MSKQCNVLLGLVSSVLLIWFYCVCLRRLLSQEAAKGLINTFNGWVVVMWKYLSENGQPGRLLSLWIENLCINPQGIETLQSQNSVEKTPVLETKNIGSDFIMSVFRDKVLGGVLKSKIWERGGVWQCKGVQLSWRDGSRGPFFSQESIRKQR